MKIMVRQIRLHTRPLFGEYQLALEQHWPSCVDHKVIVHGEGEISHVELGLLQHAVWRDYRGKTEKHGSLPQLQVLLFDEFLHSDADVLIITDDDAVFEVPHIAIHFIKQLVGRYPMLGGFGPLSGLWYYWRYKKVDNDSLLDLKGEAYPICIGHINNFPWCPHATQMYTRKALEIIDWRSIFHNIAYWCDYPIFMELQRKGFDILEINFPFYKHRGFSGRKGSGAKTFMACDTREEALRTLEMDMLFLREFFADVPRYITEIEKMHEGQRARILKD